MLTAFIQCERSRSETGSQDNHLNDAKLDDEIILCFQFGTVPKHNSKNVLY